MSFAAVHSMSAGSETCKSPRAQYHECPMSKRSMSCNCASKPSQIGAGCSVYRHQHLHSLRPGSSLRTRIMSQLHSCMQAERLSESRALASHPASPCMEVERLRARHCLLEVARALLRNLPDALVEKRMLDYSQVLRLAVGCAHLLHGDAWPQHVAVVSCGDLSSLTLQAEHAAPLICGLLYNDNHWACLVVQRPTSTAVVYDSLPGRKTADIIYDHACAFLTHLAELPEWQSQPRLRPLCASAGRALRKHLATKAYHIDLVHLAWALFHTNDAKVAALVTEMQQSD